jgi:hypothetical protein
MKTILNVKDLKATDEAWKGGPLYNKTSSELAQLYDDNSSALTLNYLRMLGLGNKRNQSHPLEMSVLRRLIDSLSVVYALPATRTLEVGGDELEDDDVLVEAMVDAFKRSAYDLLWQRIDCMRNLHRTVVVEWAEDHSSQSVGAIVYGPHQVIRSPSVIAPHAIEYDSQVLLQIRSGLEDKDNLYRAWVKDGDQWKCWIVNEHGEMEGEQPFGESGTTPYGDILPLQIVCDEHPTFRAWLPSPASRVSWALGINAAIGDIAFLVQQEVHTIKVIKTDSSAALPTETGPDSVIKVPTDGDFQALSMSPKIAESKDVIDQFMRLWAISEHLPNDAFSTAASAHSGIEIRVSSHALSLRREKQVQLMGMQEQKAWGIYSRLHNTFASEWGAGILAETAHVRVAANNSWQPFDTTERQNVVFKNLAGGFISRIQAAQELFGFTRDQAILHLERVNHDAEAFPAGQYQNPGAMVDDAGALPALGGGSATAKTSGAFNPEPQTSTDGASLTDAVAKGKP